jgi:hypothetical protein
VSRDDLTRLWADTFDATVVLTIDGNEERVARLVATLPFDPRLLTVDRAPRGIDCETGRPEANHHIVVGKRHRKVVADARRRGLKNVLVLEDDAEFVPGDPEALRRVLAWLRRVQTWDVFYLGFGAPFMTRCSYAARNIIRVYRPFLAHALCYNHRVFDQILAIDFSVDHRPPLFRAIENLAFSNRREAGYFRDGVGSLDTWLSFRRLKKYAAHPILVVQTSLPPGTEANWLRRTGRPYDVHDTPGQQVNLALAVHYAFVIVAVLLTLALVGGLSVGINR